MSMSLSLRKCTSTIMNMKPRQTHTALTTGRPAGRPMLMLTLMLVAVCPILVTSFSTQRLSVSAPAFSARRVQQQQQQQQQGRLSVSHTNLSATNTNTNTNTDANTLGTETSADAEATAAVAAIDDFERWFAGNKKTYLHPQTAHTIFGASLRGLEWKGVNPNDANDKTTEICRVPASMVLQSNYQTSDWDAQLACQLWTECSSINNDSSPISGYCRFLMGSTLTVTKDKGDCPDSTSPNALRHWTQAQRQLLASTQSGQQLLDFEVRQQGTWRKKYDQLQLATSSSSSSSSSCTWPQFAWAMEVVHSRAFRGQSYSTSPTSMIPSLLLPIFVAAAGWSYNFSVAEPSNTVLGALAVLATLPVLFSLVQETPSSAVLLPLIDSANHVETADSVVVFDPIQQCFQLQVGPKCFVPQNDGNGNDTAQKQTQQTQLFITYGPKTDTELLLNYGFLPNFPCSDGTDEAARDQQRRRLAEEFKARNA